MSDEIAFETRGPLGVVTMTRPKALNALTLGMIRLMHRQLDDWAEDRAIAAVVIRGDGERAFCAGGDVRAVWTAGQDGAFSPGKAGHLAADFFREEYRLNRRIHTFPKPYVALIDGIVMGGGVGLSIHGDLRLGGARSLFAMPETAIGLFPDVGGSYFLPRLPGALGLYLALTGDRLKAADCLIAGIATHLTPQAEEVQVLAALAAADWSQGLSGAEAALAPLTGLAEEPGHLEAQDATIARCFADKESVEAVIAALEAEGGDWATTTLATLAKRSPTSMKVAFEQLRRGAELDFDACMVMEYRMSQTAMRPGSDFYEGIRAVLVDKDHAPKWQPATLEAVTPEAVAAWFEPLGAEDLTF
ncbi:MAG: enoyl-CoA hydratase/isomerase family protein [Rhodospirillales bacterium]